MNENEPALTAEGPPVPLPQGITRAGVVSVQPDGTRCVTHFHFDGVDLATGGELTRKWAAACLLHGEITWEIVDALRESVAYHADRRDDARGPLARQSREYHQALIETLEPVADLIESLLPPRG